MEDELGCGTCLARVGEAGWFAVSNEANEPPSKSVTEIVSADVGRLVEGLALEEERRALGGSKAGCPSAGAGTGIAAMVGAGALTDTGAAGGVAFADSVAWTGAAPVRRDSAVS
ncbi:MAG TPA: hypothetical protein VN811_15675 [Thermoanaerobaculia bacterium]|nr:hypothetical protein [Thermoanaerobaculia bacterium]HXT52480.1 hypothetical protein [Thermoanaerobaculia bacterium]